MNAPAFQLPIVLAGCGRWGKNILRDLLGLGCTVTVVDPSAAAREAALDLGAFVACSSLSELSAPPQGFVVACTSSEHYRTISLIFEDFPGIPVYAEKPLALRAAEARELAARAPDRLFVMDKWRYHPGILKLAELRRDHVFGKLLGLRCMRTDWSIPHLDADPVHILLSHDLSIALEILGEIPKPRAAQAVRDGDAQLYLSAQLGSDPWVNIEVGARALARARVVEAFFESATVALPDAYAPALTFARAERGWPTKSPSIEELALPIEMPLRAELAAFLKHITGAGPAPKSSAEEGARIIEIMEELRSMACRNG